MFEPLRVKVAARRVKGKLLDVGSGPNRWAERVGGISVDRIMDAPHEQFDTITMLAVLNYITPHTRRMVLTAVRSHLTPYGRLLVTCTTPLGGFLHCLVRPDQPRGIAPAEVRALVGSCGFQLVYDRQFMWGLNRLYVFGRAREHEALAPAAYRKEVEMGMETHANRPH